MIEIIWSIDKMEYQNRTNTKNPKKESRSNSNPQARNFAFKKKYTALKKGKFERETESQTKVKKHA